MNVELLLQELDVHRPGDERQQRCIQAVRAMAPTHAALNGKLVRHRNYRCYIVHS